MKIAHITTVHPADDIRIYHKEYKSTLEIFDAYLIAPKSNLPDANFLAIPKYSNRLERILLQNNVRKIIKDLKPDLIHIHDPELIFLAIYLKRKGIKIIMDMHEDLPKQISKKGWIPVYMRPLLSRISRFLISSMLNKFDAVIFATDSIRDSFRSSSINAVIKNYPLLSEFGYLTTNPSKSKNQFVYVGGISKERGINEMIKAANIASEYHTLVFAVAGKTDLNLKNRANSDRRLEIIHHQWLSRPEVFTLLNESVAGLVVLHETPNHIESLPIKMFEYMAAGIPVIASDFPLWRSIVEKFDCGILVDPDSPQEIADAMRVYIENPLLARKSGENGRSAILRELNWEKQSEMLIDIYYKVSANDLKGNL